MDCLEFFDTHTHDVQKCVSLQKHSIETLISWEAQSASKFSPSVVGDDEILARQIMSPLHFDVETNKFTAAAFSDVKDKGGSVNRLAHTSEADVNEALAARVEKKNEYSANRTEAWGVLHLNCGDIRSLVTTMDSDVPLRGFGVYDTALENDVSHADICQMLPEGGRARSLRKELLNLANRTLREKLGH